MKPALDMNGHRFRPPRHVGAGIREYACERCPYRTTRLDTARPKPLPPCAGKAAAR